MVACLFDDTMLLAKSEGELQRVVDQFYSVCVRRKLRVIIGKSINMVSERKEIEMVDFRNPYKVTVPVAERWGGSFKRRENGGSERVLGDSIT